MPHIYLIMDLIKNLKFNSIWKINAAIVEAQFNPNIQTISDPKSKGAEAKRVDFTSKTESRVERAWRLMRLCRCHPRGERICRMGLGSGAAHSIVPRNLTHFSTHHSAFIQLLTRWRERGGCPNINTLRTIPGTRIRDKRQWDEIGWEVAKMGVLCLEFVGGLITRNVAPAKTL